MNIVETLDILPQLIRENPEVALFYITAKAFCNKQGYLTVKLQMIGKHLNLNTDQIKNICKTLKEKQLLIKETSGVVLPELESFSSRKSQTELRDYASQEIPIGYEVLLDEQLMYECYTTLGSQLWRVLAQIASYFKLDYHILIRTMYNKKFKQKFLEVRKRVEGAALITGEKVTKRRKKRAPSKSQAELVKQLYEEIHIRNGIEISREEWKSPQLLRVFALIYRKRYQEDYVFTTNPFSSLEMKEIKKIFSALDENPGETISFMKWCFSVKSLDKNVINPLRIRFCSSDNVIREYIRLRGQGLLNKKAVESSNEGSGGLPTNFIEWIVENHSELQDVYLFSKKEDVVWLKQAYENNDLPDDNLKPIIEEAIRRGII